jgi:hypothetical protein
MFTNVSYLVITSPFKFQHFLFVLHSLLHLGGFGTNTSTGFGQSSFGAKPTGTAAPTFQSTGFGSNTSMFGSTGTTTSQPSGGLFGTPTATFGAAQPTAGFGAPATNTGFGGIYVL